MKRRNDEGATLIEIMVAIALLAIIVIPACSSLILSHKINAKTEKVLQAQLAVSSAVETLMAEGIPNTVDAKTPDNEDYGMVVNTLEITKEDGTVVNEEFLEDRFPAVVVKITDVIKKEDTIIYYNVSFAGDEDIEVTTSIRAVEPDTEDAPQDPGQEGGSQ